VTGWAVGDEVCALLSGGGYAERVAVPGRQLLPVPAGVTLQEAASLPEVVCTVWSNVFLLAALQPGEVLLVHGGTSGIGTMAVQLAARHGARVLCTVGSPDKARRAEELGAQRAIRYRDEGLRGGRARAGRRRGRGARQPGRQLPGPQRQGPRTGGRLVVIGLQGGTSGELDLGALLTKRASVHATSLRARPAQEKAAIVAAVRAQVWPAIESGEVRPVVDRVLTLAEVAQAHRVLEESGHVGKVVLSVSD
jgi:NADPH:quinone reductase-like Zn-dependent oxidoreductase